jgi:glycosyltransferase involved in cell wall biosynthesis
MSATLANVARMVAGETGTLYGPRPTETLDPSLHLLVPEHEIGTSEPELSIVIPALNEEVTVGDFVEWCREGLAAAGVAGEVLIVDSSTDRTEEIALEHGARVLKTPRRGLGRAYIDALPYVRGSYILMGDADCTYDFRLLAPFVDKLREGFAFVMGSRWAGSIEPGSMPALHRYLGTPVTTWILNLLYGSSFSDIHCGMRAITRDALIRMNLSSQSWEYASEMVLKSVHMQLRTTEVPVRFLKDREGRESHHKRAGWTAPWKAAWINVRAMFVHGADFFVLKPGLLLLALGLVLTIPLSFGRITVGPVTFSLYWMLAGLTLTVVGLQCFYLGCIAQILYDYTGAAKSRWLTLFPYTRTVVLSAAAFLLGVALIVPLIVEYVRAGLLLPGEPGTVHHLAVTGLLATIVGFMTFAFTLVLHAASMARSEHGDRAI